MPQHPSPPLGFLKSKQEEKQDRRNDSRLLVKIVAAGATKSPYSHSNLQRDRIPPFQGEGRLSAHGSDCKGDFVSPAERL